MGTVELGRVTAGVVTVYDANNNMQYDRGERVAVEQDDVDGTTIEITDRNFVAGALKELLGVSTLRPKMRLTDITQFARAKEKIYAAAALCHFRDVEAHVVNLRRAAHRLNISPYAQRDDAIERGAMQGVLASLMQGNLLVEQDEPWKALEWVDRAEQCADRGNVPFSESMYAGLQPAFQKHYEQALVHAAAAADVGDIGTMTLWLNTAERDAPRAKLPLNRPQVVEIRVKGYTKAYALAMQAAEGAVPSGGVEAVRETLALARSHAEQAKIVYDTTRGEKILHDVCGVRAHQLLRSVVYYIANEQFLSAKSDFEMLLMYAEEGGVTVDRALIWQLETEIRAGIAVQRMFDPRTWNRP